MEKVDFGEKPKTRGDCLPGGLNEVRPCRHTWCKYHLVSTEASCTLDVADQGEHTLEEIAEIMGGLSRERIRQIEETALRKLRQKGVSLKQFSMKD